MIIKEIKTETVWDGTLEVSVKLDEAAEDTYLWAVLLDEEGNEADRIFPLPAEQDMQFCMQVEEPHLWDVERRYTYQLQLSVENKDERVLTREQKRVYFYEMDEQEDGWLLNKKLLLNVPVDPVSLEKTVPSLAISMQVVRNGVMIENRCVFADVGDYVISYEIWDGDNLLQSGQTQAQVPAGASRLITLPFLQPMHAGMFRYRTAICLPRDTTWGMAGTELVSGEAQLTTFLGV